ncbi:hypothetical protein IIE18_13685 [Pseudomonas sp. V1]|uniref:phage tail terminator protein n=1 Tax=Pseudomonas arcuscaelestis TaxID=2710591 RepID=UPI00193F9A8C|nr:hypothetical protein [Pseudomonas arcuscaelestis]MBM3106188.1 hypothetical protein [Pseudomonas arcuscaelestis]
MRLNVIVAHLRAYCPTFSTRIAAGIDWDAVASSSKLQHPSAYVIASDDQAEPNDLQTGVRQVISDGFDVVVVLDTSDERGQEAAQDLHELRAEIWRALVGWKPDSEYDAITYGGGALIFINRARVIYRYSFSAEFQLGRNRDGDPAETWHERELDGLPPLEGIDTRYDFIDPLRDSNVTPGGPDGRIELETQEDLNP